MEQKNYTLDLSEQVFHVTTNSGVRLEIRVTIVELNDSSNYQIVVFDKDKEINKLVYTMYCEKFVFFSDLVSNIVATFQDFYSYV